MKRLIYIVIFHFSLPVISMDIAGDIIKKQNKLASSLLEMTWKSSYEARMERKAEFEEHIKKYSQTPVAASAHARLGDILRELHMNGAAKKEYLAAYSDPKALTLAKG